MGYSLSSEFDSDFVDWLSEEKLSNGLPRSSLKTLKTSSASASAVSNVPSTTTTRLTAADLAKSKLDSLLHCLENIDVHLETEDVDDDELLEGSAAEVNDVEDRLEGSGAEVDADSLEASPEDSLEGSWADSLEGKEDLVDDGLENGFDEGLQETSFKDPSSVFDETVQTSLYSSKEDPRKMPDSVEQVFLFFPMNQFIIFFLYYISYLFLSCIFFLSFRQASFLSF